MSNDLNYKIWENNIYAKGHHINSYPYDLVVSMVLKLYSNSTPKVRSKTRVLDLGCGTGNNSKFLAGNGFRVFRIDGSRSAIDICKSRFKKLSLKGGFVDMNFSKLPFEDNFFDLVIDRESF